MSIAPAYVSEMNNLIPVGNEIRIAILDDDEDDFFIIDDYIKGIAGKRFKVDWYGDYNSAMQQIRNGSYDLYFVDYFLGNHTGLDLLREASAMGFDKPIILLTGFGNRAIDISAMEYGATDYLVKTEINTEKLERCIRYSLERAHFLQELKTREAKYRNLFESSKDGVFIADTSFIVKEANPVARLLLQSQNGVWQDFNLFNLIEDEVLKARIQNVLNSGGNIDDLEIRISAGNEEPKICQLSLSVQKENENSATVHGIIRDITNIKKAQWASLQAEKMAANERLIRMLTHEIRNPLNNIILSADQLMTHNQDESQKDFLAIINRNSLRINQIISELLNLAHPAELVFEQHDLLGVVEESLQRAQDRIDLNRIQVEKNLPETSLHMDLDRAKLVIALTNILINAVEAMEPGKGLLRIALHSMHGSNTIIIRDNGKGIPKEYLPRLFDPFFSLKQNGVGLGLTAAYSIFQSHKASVHVESKEGEGTMFMISFKKL